MGTVTDGDVWIGGLRESVAPSLSDFLDGLPSRLAEPPGPVLAM
jgi:hypothetical protein